MAYETKILLDGLVWGEGPRWHEGKLWFSDIMGRKVMNVDLNGKAETIAEVPALPSGLGWLPDGRLLIVSAGDSRLLRLDPNGLSVAADLSKLAIGINDMVVDNKGNAYVGSYGYDITQYKGGPADGWITLVTPDGNVSVAGGEMMCPNGMVITPDGHTLIAADTFTKELIAFSIESNCSLTGRRVWAQLEEAGPDGICLDAEGAIWAATPKAGEVIRVREGGQVTHRIKVSSTPLACMLGGPERRTLFIVSVAAHEINDPFSIQEKNSRIEIDYVEVSGAGLP